jgi:hypothetical protein
VSAALVVLPDAERVVVDFLRAQPELGDTAERVYTALPAEPTWPAVRVVRWGGWPVISRPLVLDQALCQVDVWGGTKAQASELARVMRALLAERLAALPEVSGVSFLMLIDNPDDTYSPARPHWRFDVSVMLRPPLAAPAGFLAGAGRPGSQEG